MTKSKKKYKASSRFREQLVCAALNAVIAKSPMIKSDEVGDEKYQEFVDARALGAVVYAQAVIKLLEHK
jgi:isopentenyldiphosphate isomerase